MTHWLLTVLTVAITTLQVEISTFQGEPRSGEWRGLADGHVAISVGGKDETVALSEVLEIRFRGETAAKFEKPAGIVTLSDGSTLSGSQVTVSGKQLKLTSAALGDLALPQTDVTSIRFADRFTSVDDQWNKLADRERKSDLLVVRKDDTLDFLDGVVVEVTDKSVKFLLDGDEVSTKRDKVFGLLFAQRPNTVKAPVSATAGYTVRIELANGDVLMAASLTESDGKLIAKRAAKSEIALPLGQLKSIDLSQGKLRYLSQMDPREVKYTPYFDTTWEYRRDTNMDGGLLRLGNKVYQRGLCIHSKTLLKYRLGGDYRRFQAVTGIDHLVASNGYGDCKLVISGDGKKLLEADIKAKDAAKPIDLDVADVVVLEVLVDYGGNLDISDHLDLADAKLIK